eukprot:CAMPEP_0118921504 /NCGR_PEP_ID=MMETSP1169-20130426/754_1 /TAXON_ID=36882 /ORGANISM="Pyramimonas obovata, Strain CCMP722" /LENGTH=538 /DNA_ID=CAMNT_0006862233 /DNA_START=234 /DNA_END=1850 /DNA_ORIENTATION=-
MHHLLDLHQHVDTIAQGLQHMPFATGIGPTCAVMNCGDVEYRSTLDAKLRMEETGVSPIAWGLLFSALYYLTAQPGVLSGALDYYLLSPLDRATRPRFRKGDFKMEKKLGAGAFGEVYKAKCNNTKYLAANKIEGDSIPVVVKKATDFGIEEAWMNERVMRACPDVCAAFLDAFEDSTAKGKPLWLIWDFEGTKNLSDLITSKQFPYNMEEGLFGRPLNLPNGKTRKVVIMKAAMQQVLEATAALHATGIVHRDLKPQNLVLSDVKKKLKIIDLGGAADLRIGINYVPQEYLLDPRYCAPERFIMSTSTPLAPPLVIAALLAPVLWGLNRPDKFDMYAAGLILMQMAFPSLRSDNNLIAFRKVLEDCDFDLRAWRARVTAGSKTPKGLQEGFELLDESGGAGWELACGLLEKKPSNRMDAKAALSHRWFRGSSEGLMNSALLASFDKSIGLTDENSWILNSIARNGTEGAGGFTEGQLQEMGYKGKAATDPKELPTIFVSRLQRTVARVATRANNANVRRIGMPGLKFWQRDSEYGAR